MKHPIFLQLWTRRTRLYVFLHLVFRAAAESEVKAEIFSTSAFEWSVYDPVNKARQSSNIWLGHILPIFVQWSQIFGQRPTPTFKNMNSA